MKTPYTYYKNLSEPKKASLWYLISSVLQKGISFFVVPLYVRYLTSSEYGHVMMFFSWQSVFMIFVTLNLYCGVYTKAMVDYVDERDQYTTSYLLFVNFFTSPAITFWSVRQRVENKYYQMVFLTIAKSILTPLLCIILLLNTDLRANSLIWGLLIVDSLFGIYLYVSQLIKGKCFYNYKYWIHALKFNIPLIPHYLSLVVLSVLIRSCICRMQMERD